MTEMGAPRPLAVSADSTCADDCCASPAACTHGAECAVATGRRTRPVAGLGVAGLDGRRGHDRAVAGLRAVTLLTPDQIHLVAAVDSERA